MLRVKLKNEFYTRHFIAKSNWFAWCGEEKDSNSGGNRGVLDVLIRVLSLNEFLQSGRIFLSKIYNHFQF